MKYFLIFLISLVLSSPILAADKIHYFDLQNRPADEVIPLIQPFLEGNEAISGDGYQLFIKASQQRKGEIENLISAVDKAVKSFLISVTNDEYVATRNNTINASITARTGDAEINVGEPVRDKSGVTVHIDSRNAEDKSDKTQFVRVQEGKPAFISRESLHIIPIYAYVQRPNGNFLIEHNHLSPSKQNGFYVIARSADGKTANVNIQSASSNKQTYQGYGQDQTYVDTTLQVPFGTWFELGGNTEIETTESKGVLYKTKKNKQRYKKIFLKIELTN